MLSTRIFVAPLLLMPLAAALSQDTKRPNVLFIAIDDLRDWPGCYGVQPAAKTPNLDRVARRGTVFTRAYCAAPWCNPSRTASDRRSAEHFRRLHALQRPVARQPGAEGRRHAAAAFQGPRLLGRGAGKIFHHDRPSQDPDSWDDYWPSKTQCMLPMPAAKPPKNGMNLRASVDWGPADRTKQEMPDWKVAEWVAGQLQRTHDQPFFLACGFFRPHLPWYVPAEYFSRVRPEDIKLPPVNDNDLEDVPPFARRLAIGEGLPFLDDPKDFGNIKFPTFPAIREAGRWREALQAYLACISFTDDCLGHVLQALEGSPHKDNTVIVIWSDHGWHLGEKLHWEKTTLWEEAAKCVLMVAGPGTGEAGKRIAAPVNLIDLYPTLLEVCKLPGRGDWKGSASRRCCEIRARFGPGPASRRTAAAIIRCGRRSGAIFVMPTGPRNFMITTPIRTSGRISRSDLNMPIPNAIWPAALPRGEALPINDFSHLKPPSAQKRE